MKISTTSNSKVAITQSGKAWAKDLNYEDIKSMVLEAVMLAGGFESLVKEAQTIVIKPNLVSSTESKTGKALASEINGITVDWRVVKAVSEIIRIYNKNGKIYVMEGSVEGKTLEVMQKMNYIPDSMPEVSDFIALESDSGGWKEYNSDRLCKVYPENGVFHKEYYLNRRYKEADVLISVACLKTHSSAVITGGIKNLSIGATPANIYGSAPDNASRMKMVEHNNAEGDLHKWIHDYYICRPADFTILDGLQGFQNGPGASYVNSSSEDVMNMRVILAGNDGVSVDTIAALVMNWDPESIKYLKMLQESKAGNLDTKKITVVGKKVDEIRRDFGTIKIAPAGGEKIKDKKSPKFTLQKLEIPIKTLNLSLKVDDKTTKVELYLDGILNENIITSNYNNIKLNLENIMEGKHVLEICCYDRFLNRSTQSFTFNM